MKQFTTNFYLLLLVDDAFLVFLLHKFISFFSELKDMKRSYILDYELILYTYVLHSFYLFSIIIIIIIIIFKFYYDWEVSIISYKNTLRYYLMLPLFLFDLFLRRRSKVGNLRTVRENISIIIMLNKWLCYSSLLALTYRARHSLLAPISDQYNYTL